MAAAPDPDRAPDWEHLHRALSDACDAFRPVFADFGRIAGQMYEALGSAEGIAQLQRALDLRDEHRRQWEAEHPGLRYGQPCHCWCRERGHSGASCQGDAVTFEVRYLFGDPIQVPLCGMCAALNVTAAGRS